MINLKDKFRFLSKGLPRDLIGSYVTYFVTKEEKRERIISTLYYKIETNQFVGWEDATQLHDEELAMVICDELKRLEPKLDISIKEYRVELHDLNIK